MYRCPVLNSSESIGGVEGESRRERLREMAWQELLDKSAPAYEDESFAPPIDPVDRSRLLKAYMQNGLSRETAARVFSLTNRFRSWSKALTEVMTDKSAK